MKLLLLNGHGISLRVDNARLHITDGTTSPDETPQEYVFLPKRIDIDHVIIYAHNGNITLDAIRWLVKHNVQVSILNWDGKLLTTMLPAESVQVKTKFAQYRAYGDAKMRVALARLFISAKFTRTQENLTWLHTRYDTINPTITKDALSLRKANTIPEIMMVEGRVAGAYWAEFSKAVPSRFEFETREYQKRPRGAGDTTNCLLNYGYAILEAEILKAIHTAGLDPHIGFLHEMNIGKNSLAYDLQEPFRFLIDRVVISLLESGLLEKRDFIRTETYTLRLRPTGAKKIITAIDKELSRKVSYKGQTWSWRYIIQDKTTELAHHLVGKRTTLSLAEPKDTTSRQDNSEMRDIIKDISYVEWKRLGFSKGTLHYLKHNALSEKPFTMNAHVRARISELYPKIALKTT